MWAIWHGGHLFEAYWLLRVQLAQEQHILFTKSLHDHTTANLITGSITGDCTIIPLETLWRTHAVPTQ